MIELPNYSSQLMQQLWALKKEGHFCDCTILVGDSPHRAHKLVLAASSMLFRSLLDGSDTISIDTAMVSSQEFGCLLDMVYTGKLPLGKHNVSRIVAAADSLQMFDVAVSFKNVLTSLVNPQLQNLSTHTPNITVINKAQSLSPKGSASPKEASKQTRELKAETQAAEEPACKRRLVQTSDSAADGDSSSAGQSSSGPVSRLVEAVCQHMQLLSCMSSVLQLLSEAAHSSLGQQERQAVCLCCEEADPRVALEKLVSRVQDGHLSEAALLVLLQTIQQREPSSFPTPLLSLLEEEETEKEKEEQQLEEEQEEQQEEQQEEKQEEQQEEEQEEKQEEQQEEQQEEKQEEEQTTEEPEENRTEADSEKENSRGGEEPQEEERSKEETEEDDKDTSAKTDSSSPPPSSSSSFPSPSKPFSCKWCKKGFAYKCRMLAHVKRCPMSKEHEQPCPQCPAKLPNQRALKRHQAEAHRGNSRVKKKVSCDLCGRAFAHPSGMIYHKRTEHFEEKPFACEECGAKFGANSSLKNHMRLHTGEKPYCCKHCDMSFSVAAALAYHTKKKHSEGKMYECQYCKAVFAQSIELTRHVRTHTGDRPYVCRECGKGYSQASGLTVHLHTFHNLSEPHDCQKCCLSFASLEEHRQHMQDLHSKEFNKCSTCDKVFTSAALLDKHKATHTGTKPFSCDLCNKSYQQLSGLWYHNRTNHPDVFASHTQQLKTLVQCDVCFKFFPSAASVAKHQAAEHQGSAASAIHCPFCPAVLGGDEEMQDHVSSQHLPHSSEVFSCPLCSTFCTTQAELQEHLMSAHMESQEQEAGEEQASTSHMIISADPAGSEQTESVTSAGQTQQVLVTLAGGRESESSAEVVEVNMYDLLNNSVTFICEDKP